MGVPPLAVPPGAPDAVDVGLEVAAELEVHDVGDARDVEPAGDDVGGDEHVGVGAAEVADGAVAVVLGAVAVDARGEGPREGGPEHVVELVGELGVDRGGGGLALDKDEHLVGGEEGAGGVELEEGGETARGGVAVAEEVEALGDERVDAVPGLVGARADDVVVGGDVAVREGLHFLVPGRGPHEGLRAGGVFFEEGHDVADLGGKAHVEEAVGLVHGHESALPEVHHPLAREIGQATGGGDEHVGFVRLSGLVLPVSLTSVGHRDLELTPRGELHKHLVGLLGELPGGAYHQALAARLTRVHAH